MRQRAHGEHADRHHRAGIARADDGVDLAAAHHFKGNRDRRIFLAQRDARRLVHGHHLGCRYDVELRRAAVFRQFLFDGISRADEDQFDGEILGGEQGALDDGLRGMVSAHRIDGDFRHGLGKAG